MQLALEQHTIENPPITWTSPKPTLPLSVPGGLVPGPLWISKFTVLN